MPGKAARAQAASQAISNSLLGKTVTHFAEEPRSSGAATPLRMQVLVQAGAYVKDDACRALILLVVNAAQVTKCMAWATT